MRKKELKPIQVDSETYKLLCRIYKYKDIPYNPILEEEKDESTDEKH